MPGTGHKKQCYLFEVTSNIWNCMISERKRGCCDIVHAVEVVKKDHMGCLAASKHRTRWSLAEKLIIAED